MGSGTKRVGTILGLALTAMAVAAVMVFAAPATAQDADQGGKKEDKQLVVKTPSVALAVSGSPDFARLGLPLYPGAKYVQDKEQNGLDFSLNIRGKTDVRFVVAKFRTSDSREQVRGFYQKKIGKQVTKFTEKDDDGDMTFEIKHPKDQRFVGLKVVDGRTEIQLVRVEGIDEQ
ncbi:MAG TPA: hypothetical protein VKM93_18535 [Terriglobia bacterium]|nr:hypothetical protein [Terriglobia bacterium]